MARGEQAGQMTAITYVGNGGVVAANNASVQPGLPGGLVAGDLMVAAGFIRNTAATVATPAGWIPLLADGNVLVVCRYYAAGDVAPTFTFAGGVAGDTTEGTVCAWRTAALNLRNGPLAISNASAADVAIPAAYTPARDGCVSLAIGWKQSAWTSVAALTGMTEAVDAPTATGSGMSIALDYRIDTTAAALPAGPFVVTGGAAAISKGYTLSLDQLPALTAVEQAAYPPRVLLSLTNLIIGDAVEIYRVVSGARTLVRAASSLAVTDPAFLRIDAELPFGVPVSYVAVVEGMEIATTPVTYTLTGGKVAISDAVAGTSAEVIILSWPEKAYDRRASVYQPGGRNVLVSGDFTGYSGKIELFVSSTSSLENLRAVLDTATEGTVQIRQPGGYAGVDSYAGVLAAPERRFSQDGSDERRVVTLDAVEVEGWAPALEAAGFTYADLEAAYTGLTYANLAGDYATYLALAQAEF